MYIRYTKTGTFGKLFSAGYLGLGRRYEARVCTIVISMNGAFQDEFGPKIIDYIDFSRVRFNMTIPLPKMH